MTHRFQRVVNKKALHNYHIVESIEAGIELFGGEVKSVRSGRVDLGQSYARILNNQAFLINANIPPYQRTDVKSYDPARSRRLLLHRDQIQSLIGKLSSSKVTLIPLSLYEKHNLIKVQLGLGRSKKEVDKRRVLKERDHQRRVEQELRGKE